MRTYELLFFINPDLNSNEIEEEAKKVESFIKEKGGIIIKTFPLENKILAYPINKKTSGVLGILRFQIDPFMIKDLTKWINSNNKIIRHMLTLQKPQKITQEKISELEEKISLKPKMSISKSKEKEEKIELKDIEEKLEEILNE